MIETTKATAPKRDPVEVIRYSFEDAVRYLRLHSDRAQYFGPKRPFFLPLGPTEIPLGPATVPAEELGPKSAVFSFRSLVQLFLWSNAHPVWRWGFGLDYTKGSPSPHVYVYFDRAEVWQVDPLGFEASPEKAQLVRDLYNSRIEFDGTRPVRLYPFTRQRRANDSPRLIAIDPRYGFGTPIFARTNARIEGVTGRFHAGESVAELVKDCKLKQEEVEEAIRYESGYVD